MLWYKTWLETRWRFFVALALGVAMCLLVVLTQPSTKNLQIHLPELGEKFNAMVQEYLRLSATYPGYIWSQWFGRYLLQLWSVAAVLVGAGGVVTETSRGTALWTLSLPATRRRLLAVRAGVGALELLALALAPSLLIPLLSPLIGESYTVGAAVAHSLIMFAAGTFFYALSLLLSIVFTDLVKPIIIGLATVFAMSVGALFSARLASYSVFAVMSGEKYFQSGAPPWAGLFVCVALAALMFLAALRVLERRDF